MRAVPEHRRPWMTVADVARPLEPGLVLEPALSGADLVQAVRRTPASEYVVAGPRAAGARRRPTSTGGPAPAVRPGARSAVA